jgi:hypothetical protein
MTMGYMQEPVVRRPPTLHLTFLVWLFLTGLAVFVPFAIFLFVPGVIVLVGRLLQVRREYPEIRSGMNWVIAGAAGVSVVTFVIGVATTMAALGY